MKVIRLKPIWWQPLPRADALCLVERARGGKLSIEGNYRQSGSSQIVYFRPGTVSEARRLREVLAPLGKPLPTVDDVHAALTNDPFAPRLYEFVVDRDVWYLRNTSRMEPGSPFERTDWSFFFEVAGGYVEIAVRAEDFLEVLDLLRLLNGELRLEEVVRRAGQSAPAKDFLRRLVEAGAIEEVPRADCDLQELPEMLFLGHAGFAVRDREHLVVVDPVVFPTNEHLSQQGRSIFSILSRASAIVISHHHWDHLHLQTLARIDRNKPIFVPRCRGESFMNPSMSRYLRYLGFTRVEERGPWDEIEIGSLKIRFAPFYGEPFGLDSRFDASTLLVDFDGKRLYSSVDAWRDEQEGMEETIASIAQMGPVDLFLFGASNQQHDPPYLAPGLRHYSNELKDHPELIRYHPNTDDIARWVEVLQPRCLVPYAEFIFGGAHRADLRFSERALVTHESIRDVQKTRFRVEHQQWCESLRGLTHQTGIPLLALHPMQGISMNAS